VQLHYYEVVAPSDGIVGDIPVHVGDRVATSTLLTTVDRNVGLEAYINVPLERAPEVRVGLPVQILDSNGNVAVNCRVTFISPQVDTTTQSVLVKAAIPQGREALRSAQFVRARVIWRSYPGLTVPVTAVARVSGQFFVFVAEPGEKGTVARQRPIKVGDIIDNNYVVQDGLKAGDKVIVSGTQILADGSPVVVQS
jgi:RND family efflux transporter MFP subunit